METLYFDIAVIGGGPAGLAAAKSASDSGSKVIIIEREDSLGGILKQCIHDGFGLQRYKEKLSGPEYAYREIKRLEGSGVKTMTLTYVTGMHKEKDGSFLIEVVSKDGVSLLHSKKVILATGCRERTSKQVYIHGTNPSGVLTAGAAQYYINVMGKMPGKEFVVLGSGDIGLIMARRITLEGGHVEGVYEAKPTPSGLTRNIVQCLEDFAIPLHLSHTVTRVFGVDRLEAVEISEVDDKMHPIKGTERLVKCDSLILSVGLIPENELGSSLGLMMDSKTKGPVVDQSMETMVPGIFCCGNAMHVNDLVDYVSESGEIAGRSASDASSHQKEISFVKFDGHFGYVVPSAIDVKGKLDKAVFFFRSREDYHDATLVVEADGKVILKKKYSKLKPPEMERISIDLPEGIDSLSFGIEVEP